jgi:hypothetical protein
MIRVYDFLSLAGKISAAPVTAVRDSLIRHRTPPSTGAAGSFPEAP